MKLYIRLFLGAVLLASAWFLFAPVDSGLAGAWSANKLPWARGAKLMSAEPPTPGEKISRVQQVLILSGNAERPPRPEPAPRDRIIMRRGGTVSGGQMQALQIDD